MTQTGRCYCGEIRFEVSAPIGVMANCHCRNCRRANGGAFTTFTPVETDVFRVTRGETVLRSYATGTGQRFFCGNCGGRLFTRPDVAPHLTNLLVSTLDDEPAHAPALHVNVESKAPWYEIRDDLRQYEALPPMGGAESADGGAQG